MNAYFQLHCHFCQAMLTGSSLHIHLFFFKKIKKKPHFLLLIFQKHFLSEKSQYHANLKGNLHFYAKFDVPKWCKNARIDDPHFSPSSIINYKQFENPFLRMKLWRQFSGAWVRVDIKKVYGLDVYPFTYAFAYLYLYLDLDLDISIIFVLNKKKSRSRSRT